MENLYYFAMLKPNVKSTTFFERRYERYSCVELIVTKFFNVWHSYRRIDKISVFPSKCCVQSIVADYKSDTVFITLLHLSIVILDKADVICLEIIGQYLLVLTLTRLIAKSLLLITLTEIRLRRSIITSNISQIS